MTTASAIEIGHDDLGSGAPALLCLPGWCGDRTVFEPLLPIAARSRRIVTADLRDHGGSTRTDIDFTATDVVDDMITLIEQRELETVVPLALSHAGWPAIELRRRLGPDRVQAIVLLDWMVLGPPPGFVDALAGLQNEESWQQVRAGLFDMWTTSVDATAVHEYVADMGGYGYRHWNRAGREIATAFATNGTPAAALEQLDMPCPTLHLYAQPADDALLAAQQTYAQHHPWFRVRRLAAHSHFPTFEVPGDIAHAIEEFLRTI
ncbi:alpha/beta hydrolase [Aldersonia sp. NBC_00410]|uniref:alpha/beta fold hydrolase n=1 Tax=Aldersonia sp. NBC_00410 TaxID=2975954 RepID=UPI0022505BE7|nr:alpha/beta hydrolase [Aldersonia sp. NBC_00410]MCX5042833.1 alpha/beta hydrolase [Aldersonia sp. NBC_00410]